MEWQGAEIPADDDPNDPVVYVFVLPADLATRFASFLRRTDTFAYRYFLLGIHTLLDFQAKTGTEWGVGALGVKVRASRQAEIEDFLASQGWRRDMDAAFEPVPGRGVVYPLRPMVGPMFRRPLDMCLAASLRTELLAAGHLPPESDWKPSITLL